MSQQITLQVTVNVADNANHQEVINDIAYAIDMGLFDNFHVEEYDIKQLNKGEK